MTYLRIALQKNRFIDSLVENFNKKYESAKCLDFQFHNPKFSQERYFGSLILLQPLTYVWKKYLKATSVEDFERKL